MTHFHDQTVTDKRRVRDVIDDALRARSAYPLSERAIDALAFAGLSEATLDGLLDGTLVAQQGWQSIETAPRDATAVLVMRDIWPGTKTGRATKCNEHNTYVAMWWGDEGKGGRWMCYMDSIDEPQCPIDPTHWMPLPAPPSRAMLSAALKETPA